MDPGLGRDVVGVLIGIATGILSGLFGVGGGVISQPSMRAIGMEPLIVIGTALPSVLPGAISGSLRYRKERYVHWHAVIATVPLGMIFAFAGAQLAPRVPGNGHLLQLATAALMGSSALRMAKPPAAQPSNDNDNDNNDPGPEESGADDNPRWQTFGAIGALAGALSGLLGIGGGVILVPALTHFARLPVKRAIATSLVCIGAFTVPGTISHSLQGHVVWSFALLLIIGVVPGAQLGAHLTVITSDRRLRVVVSVFLGAIAVLYAAGELQALLG